MNLTLTNINLVVNTMKLVLVGYSTKLLRPIYNRPDNPMFGHCIHATEAIIMIFEHDDLQMYRAPCEHADYHWWCQYHDLIIDPTVDQYLSQGYIPPYDQGKLQTRTYGRDANWNDRYLSKSYFVRDKVLEYMHGPKLMI